MTGRTLAAVLGVLLLALSACGGDDAAAVGSRPFVALDGSPREPDDAGRLVDVADDFSTLTLDGGRRYRVDHRLQSFSALDGSIQPLIRWHNQYVQVGLDGDTVQWLGGVAAVVEVPGDDPVAYFTDVLVEVGDRQLVFRSGAVFDVAPGVTPPAAAPVAVVATIDVTANHVVALEAA